jgi:hypothetical protein
MTLNFFIPDNRRAADAEKSAIMKIIDKLFCESFIIPEKKANGMDDKKGKANSKDR